VRLFCAVASGTPGQAFERRGEGTFVVECYDTKDIWVLCPDNLQELTPRDRTHGQGDCHRKGHHAARFT